jgi:four helix bundle protein
LQKLQSRWITIHEVSAALPLVATRNTPIFNAICRGKARAPLTVVGKERDLRERTMRFALDVIAFGRSLPNTLEGRHIHGQLLRAGTGTAANYRAACRGKSKPDFIAKLGTVIEESDEVAFWLELIRRAGLAPTGTEAPLHREAGELVAIFTQSQKTARANLTPTVVSVLAFFLFFVLFTSSF